MGLQVRKRTKGKSSWWNGSYSSKGVGASGSVKLGKNVTWNTGDIINGKTKQRVTVNFGNGYRWVWYKKRDKPTKQSTPDPRYVTSTKPWNRSDTLWLVGSIIAVWISSLIFGPLGFILAVVGSLLFMFIKVNWYE